jgi:uncharacterized protein (UPF0248 family)
MIACVARVRGSSTVKSTSNCLWSGEIPYERVVQIEQPRKSGFLSLMAM